MESVMKRFLAVVVIFFPLLLLAKPEISFDKTTWNFGEVWEGDTAVCYFSFKNVGDSTLKILDIRSTCGCAVAALKKKVYETQEGGKIKVNFFSRGRKGKITKSIFITTNEKENRVTRLAIVGTVKKTWSCEPRNVDFGEISGNEILVDTVVITSVTVDSIEIDSIITEPATVTARVLYNKGKTVRLEITLDPSEIKWRFIGVVRFYSNLDKARKFIIPVYARLKEKRE
jgi:hypothetical protein